MDEDIKSITYRYRERVDELVEENFGYCPQGKHFDDLLDKLHKSEDKLKEVDRDAWEVYMGEYYGL